jgi:hypothetical protein
MVRFLFPVWLSLVYPFGVNSPHQPLKHSPKTPTLVNGSLLRKILAASDPIHTIKVRRHGRPPIRMRPADALRLIGFGNNYIGEVLHSGALRQITER